MFKPSASLASCFLLIVTASAFPDEIDLPDGFFPEGIAIGSGTTFYVGSLGNGSIYKGDLNTGEGEVIVQPSGFGVTSGLSVDANRVWVAGGFLGNGRVYDGDSGELLRTYSFTAPFTSLINDVIVTNDAAYFTDAGTQKGGGFLGSPRLFIVPLDSEQYSLPAEDSDSIELAIVSSDFDLDQGFPNLNGIETSPTGGLIVGHSTLGMLFSIDLDSGDASPIVPSQSLVGPDGLVRRGTTLYVVENPIANITAVEISPDGTSGAISSTLEVTGAFTPTTAGLFGNALYTTDARFDINLLPEPPTVPPYKVYRVELN